MKLTRGTWCALVGLGLAAVPMLAQDPGESPPPRKRILAMLGAPVAPKAETPKMLPDVAIQKAGFLQPPVARFDAPVSDERSGVVAGGTFYYLRPYFQNNTGFVTTINPGQPGSQVISETLPWDFRPAFAGWIGWASPCGLGIRGRYFQFEQNSNNLTATNGITPAPGTQTTINPPLGNFLPLSTGGTAFGSPSTTLNTGLGVDQVTVGSDLRIHAIDLEAMYAWKCSCWTLLAFGGGRYLSMDQNYHASLTNDGGGAGVTETQTFNSTRRFNGGGPTLGLQGNLHVGRSGLSLYAMGRGSFLVGSTLENVAFTQIVNDPNGRIPGHVPPPATLQINPTSTRSADHTIPVGEIELGFEYGRNVGRTWIFFRGAAVNQTYFDAGNASQSTGNISLFGVQATLGVNY